METEVREQPRETRRTRSTSESSASGPAKFMCTYVGTRDDGSREVLLTGINEPEGCGGEVRLYFDADSKGGEQYKVGQTYKMDVSSEASQ